MADSALTIYLHRAGIGSIRELSELTGISKSSIDRIIRNPGIARGYQMESIARACGMSAEQVGRVILGKEERNGTEKGNKSTR